MSVTITTVSGRTRTLPAHVDPQKVAGLDEDGRIVVDEHDARSKPLPTNPGGLAPFMFGLTLCCDAYDKGYEDGTFCRKCGGGDSGNYLFVYADGAIPGLDPKVP